MSFLETIGRAFLDGIGPIQTRSATGNEMMDAQLAALRLRYAKARPWRVASVDEALAVPSIFSAVTLIASTMGTLSMEAYRNELLMAATERPRLIVRPNPFSTPYAFWFLSAFYKATRGERWWWIASRDIDGAALSLFPVPPWEIRVSAQDNNRLRPKIEWGNKIMPNEDMIQDIWFPDQTGLRGMGPLQMAGAAVSVAVESQDWAANWYSGGIPSIIGTTDQDMTEDELAALDRQWAEKPPNTPRWLTNGLTITDAPADPVKAQLTESRGFQVGEVARMFNIPGPLLEYQMSGQSLTYRNESGIWLDFRQRCLGPIFAEPMEQQVSDLLTRSTTARFNYDQLLRSDIKTRYEAYKMGVEAGFLSPEEVRKQEGLAPGGVDYAPVPQAVPQAVPTLLPVNRSAAVRCSRCNKMLAEVATPPYKSTCSRCKTVNVLEADEQPQMAFLHALTQREPAPTPNITIHTPPVNVEAPQITFQRGAIEMTAPPPPEVNVTTPEITVEVAAPDMSGVAEALTAVADRPNPPTEVNVTTPDINIPATTVTFEKGAIQSPDVSVQPANVTVNVPKQPAPQVDVHLPEPKPITRKIKRDKDSNIIEIKDEVA